MGPNGAGKVDHHADPRRTDQGRHIGHLNRVRPQPREPTQPGREDGVLLDAPAQHAGRTGREILTIPFPDRGWHTRELAVRHRAGALAGLMVVVASLTGCVASDVEVIGALGVTVDEEQRPVVVVEACKGTAPG